MKGRLNLKIPKEEQEKLNRIPWGSKRPLFIEIIKQLNELIDEYGIVVVPLIIERHVDLLSILTKERNDES